MSIRIIYLSAFRVDRLELVLMIGIKERKMLNSLPWSYKKVSFSRMEQMILVEWH